LTFFSGIKRGYIIAAAEGINAVASSIRCYASRLCKQRLAKRQHIRAEHGSS